MGNSWNNSSGIKTIFHYRTKFFLGPVEDAWLWRSIQLLEGISSLQKHQDPKLFLKDLIYSFFLSKNLSWSCSAKSISAHSVWKTNFKTISDVRASRDSDHTGGLLSFCFLFLYLHCFKNILIESCYFVFPLVLQYIPVPLYARVQTADLNNNRTIVVFRTAS